MAMPSAPTGKLSLPNIHTFPTKPQAASARDRALARGMHGLRVLRQDAALLARQRFHPRRAALGPLGVAQLRVDAFRVGVNGHGVAVFQQRDRAAGPRLGRNVTDNETMSAA